MVLWCIAVHVPRPKVRGTGRNSVRQGTATPETKPWTRLATSACPLRHHHREPDSTELCIGCSHFLLSSGGPGARTADMNSPQQNQQESVGPLLLQDCRAGRWSRTSKATLHKTAQPIVPSTTLLNQAQPVQVFWSCPTDPVNNGESLCGAHHNRAAKPFQGAQGE